MTAFDVRPFDGVGPLAFGMTPEEVHVLLGEPRMQRANPLGQRDERYPGFRVRYAAETGLMCEVTFSTDSNVDFAGISLLTDGTAIQQLAESDGRALQGLGYIVFPNLGIALADFDSDQESDKSVTVFARGQLKGSRQEPKVLAALNAQRAGGSGGDGDSGMHPGEPIPIPAFPLKGKEASAYFNGSSFC